jgi:hypothetical protein
MQMLLPCLFRLLEALSFACTEEFPLQLSFLHLRALAGAYSAVVFCF